MAFGRRKAVTLALMASATLGLGACGSGSADAETDLTTDADADAALVVYSGRNENLVGDLIKDFEERSGIDVEVRYGDTAEMAAQLQEEGSGTDADVFLSQDAGALGAVQDAGLTVALPESLTSLVPAEYRSQEDEWVGVTGRVRVLEYDPAQLPPDTLPASVYELTGEQYKGEIGIAPTNASFQSFVTAMRVVDGEDKAKEFLEGMVANDAQIYDGNVQLVEAVERGEIAGSLVNHYYRYELSAERGEDLRGQNHYFGAGDVGGLVNVSGAAIVAGTNKGASAVEFLSYLLSSEGQTYFSGHNFEYPLVVGVPQPTGLPALADLEPPAIDLSDLDSLAETQALLQEVGLL